MTQIRPAFNAVEPVKIMINVGAGLDIPTGEYIIGRLGESILNGGLAITTGVVAYGNMFKSTLMHYMFLVALARFAEATGSIYDTEISVHENHLIFLASKILEFYGEEGFDNVFESARAVLTDKTQYVGNEWYEIQKAFLLEKAKTKNLVETPFWNRGKQGPLMIPYPSFTEIDSFSDFETEDVIAMQDDNELGESGGNTIHMRQGLAKMRLLMEAPRLNSMAYNYLMMTAQLGKETMMQKGAGGKDIPVKVLTHLKHGDKIKGTTNKFTTNTNNCWQIYNVTPLLDNGVVKYPRNSEDNVKLDTDLNVIMLKNLRGKSGVSGMPIAILVSQAEGILPSLSEFYNLKEMGSYGMEGNDRSYYLSILPDVKLSRTTIRTKIDEDANLRRALNITSEMCQIDQMWHGVDPELMCTPQQLYDDLIKLGYDWNVLLKTRGWWTINNDKHPIPFLSTMDLLRMRKGLYHPYWHPPLKK